MAFKKIQPPALVPDSPDKLFLDLPRRRIPDVLPHQREIMRLYATEALDKPDVALQLPTGSGKTLVGLLIAEWRRRKNQERIVYLCPTRQLVNQVVEQAEEKYGLTVLGFTGGARHYEPTAKSGYRNADRVGITTYSSLFNTNPYFDDADVIIVDDAHAAENYIAALWSVRAERLKPEHQGLHSALCILLKPYLDPLNYARLLGTSESLSDQVWVDKIPTPVFADIRAQLIEVLDVHTTSTELAYPWSMIRDHLDACHLYISTQEVLVRPLIPPTWTHAPFAAPKQRIYMSATLGTGGDLERLTGRRPISRLAIPSGWDRQGVGRRFFIFPGMSLREQDTSVLRSELMQRAGRSLVLVPSDRLREHIAAEVKDTLGFPVFGGNDIEESKKVFTENSPAVAVVSNRYDGIDFPGDECRLLFVEGLPRATNLQERFLMSRMGAPILFNERVQVRVLQAIGRCTRSLEDYSAVVITGEELTDYLADIKRRVFLHPELQAELEFGVSQSRDTDISSLVENFSIFLENGEEWERANQDIIRARERAKQQAFPAIEQLNEAVTREIDYQSRLWQGAYEDALGFAEQVLGSLTAPELRGYRALWHYFAGSAAWLGAKNGMPSLLAKARLQFEQAKKAATGIPWLAALSRSQDDVESVELSKEIVMMQVERMETVLAQLGTTHDRLFSKREKNIIEGLQSRDSALFEQAQKHLGKLIGFEAGKVEIEGSPDPWWIASDICFVFEDHSGAQNESTLDVTKARQVASHPKWIHANVPISAEAIILPVLVTPVKQARRAAMPHLQEVAVWEIGQFRLWAIQALAAVRELRTIFIEPGNLTWRAQAIEVLEKNGLDATSLFTKLKQQLAPKVLTES